MTLASSASPVHNILASVVLWFLLPQILYGWILLVIHFTTQVLPPQGGLPQLLHVHCSQFYSASSVCYYMSLDFPHCFGTHQYLKILIYFFTSAFMLKSKLNNRRNFVLLTTVSQMAKTYKSVLHKCLLNVWMNEQMNECEAQNISTNWMDGSQFLGNILLESLRASNFPSDSTYISSLTEYQYYNWGIKK